MKKTTTTTASPEQVSGPNMVKEYRKELRALQARRMAVERQAARNVRTMDRTVMAIEKRAVREMRLCRQVAAKLDKGLQKEIAAAVRREAILVGRLS